MMDAAVMILIGVLYYAMGRHYGTTSWGRVLTSALGGGGLYGLPGTAAAGLPASAILPVIALSALVIGAVVYALEQIDRALTEHAAKRRVAAARSRHQTRGPITVTAVAGT
jgi:hypothetical protein